jgi:hypothetical protein
MNYSNYIISNWEGKIHSEIQIGTIQIRLLKLNYDALLPREGVKNLIAVDSAEEILWIAELPEDVGIRYDLIEYSGNKLKAWAGSLYCEVDIESGKILKQQFYTH